MPNNYTLPPLTENIEIESGRIKVKLRSASDQDAAKVTLHVENMEPHDPAVKQTWRSVAQYLNYLIDRSPNVSERNISWHIEKGAMEIGFVMGDGSTQALSNLRNAIGRMKRHGADAVAQQYEEKILQMAPKPDTVIMSGADIDTSLNLHHNSPKRRGS